MTFTQLLKLSFIVADTVFVIIGHFCNDLFLFY